MLFELSAYTRVNLAEKGRLFEIEEILLRLVHDLLDTTLLVTIDDPVPVENRREIDLLHRGSLRGCVEADIARGAEANERWEAYFTRQSPEWRPSKRRTQLAGVSLVTPDGSCEVFIDTDERAFVRQKGGGTKFGNQLAFVWNEESRKGKDLLEFCVSVVKKVFADDLFDYGRCCARDEYWEKNVDTSDGGASAVGLDVSKYLPGFYWGNVFGKHLSDLVGRTRVGRVPGCRSLVLGRGAFVYNELPPDAWSAPAYLENASAAMDHLARSLFFEKGREKESLRLSWSSGS